MQNTTNKHQQNRILRVLTRINGKLYDLATFSAIHPGGASCITSLHNRDSTLPFLHTHGRDKNSKMLLRMHEVKDADLIEEAEQKIPKLARVDQRLVDLHHKYDGKIFINVRWYLCRPVIIMFAGVYLLTIAQQWAQSWWIGIALWAYAIFIEVDLSHNLSHNSIFDDPKTNRWYNTYHMMLVSGLNGRLGFREHPEHHSSSNILGYDPALHMPLKWRRDAPDGLQSNVDLPRAPVVLLGSLFGFAWTTAVHSSLGLWSKIRQNSAWFCIAWTVRTAILLYLVGPIAMVISYMPPFALIALEATTHHFDQPVMLPEEYHKSKMSFVELQLRSLVGYHAPQGFMKGFPVVAVDHVYHHFLPNIADFEFPQYIKDEIDQMVREELGVVPIQRSVWTGFVEAYKQHFGLIEVGTNKGFALASSKGESLFASVTSSQNQNKEPEPKFKQSLRPRLSVSVMPKQATSVAKAA